MSEVKRYTPNKIANEIMAENAWHDSLWVRNEDYEELRKSRALHWLDANKLRSESDKLTAELAALRADAMRYRAFRSLIKRDLVAAQAMVWNTSGQRKRFDAAIDAMQAAP